VNLRLRQGLSAIALGVCATLVVAACSSGTTPQGSSSGGANAGKPGGQLRVGVSALPPGQGNPFSAIGSPSVYVWASIFDALTTVDKTGKVQPGLATSWKNIDPTHWSFTLRQGVTFSNGEPFNADAVVATVNYLTSKEGKATSVGGELSMLASAQATDPNTVEITTSTPNPVMPASLCVMYIPAPKAWAQLGAKGFATQPVGTGPFVANSFTQNSVQLTANTKSWRAPKVDKLSFTMLADQAARTQALQSKQIDLEIGVSPDQMPSLSSAGFNVVTSSPQQIMSLAFRQTSGGPIADPMVRQALNYAVNKDAMNTSLLGGKGAAPTQGTASNTFGNNPSVKGFPYDPDKAKQLLQQAGYGSGLKLSADVVVGSFPADAQIYQSAAADLAKVGVQLTLTQITFADFLSKYLPNSWDTPMFGLSWNGQPTLQASRPDTIFSCLQPKAFFCDPTVKDLLTKASTEFDENQRKQTLQDVATQMQANPPALLLMEQIDINAMASNVKGFSADNRTVHYENITVN
jgi:peptide/nickel transport system substrate-binding protein